MFFDFFHGHGSHIRRHGQPDRQRLWRVLLVPLRRIVRRLHGRYLLRLLFGAVSDTLEGSGNRLQRRWTVHRYSDLPSDGTCGVFRGGLEVLRPFHHPSPVGRMVDVEIFPETMLLSLEEIAGVFGCDVALDIRNLNSEAREALDREMAAIRSPSDEMIRRVSEASVSPHGNEKTITQSQLEKA